MTKIESQITEIPNSAENVFNFLADFNNFQKLMPSQVTNWASTVDECSFVIGGMANITMKSISKTPHTNLKIAGGGKLPFEFTLNVLITSVDAQNSKGQLVFESDMNPMVRMMVEKPLSKFFEHLAAQMKNIK